MPAGLNTDTNSTYITKTQPLSNMNEKAEKMNFLISIFFFLIFVKYSKYRFIRIV